METATRYETKVILKNIRREGWQWREYVELREGVEKVSRRLNKPPSVLKNYIAELYEEEKQWKSPSNEAYAH